MAAIVGDRFVRVRGDWLDLVTGEVVDVRVGPPPRDLEARRLRCAAARALLSADGPGLIDYGEAGTGCWFEARRVGTTDLGAPAIVLPRIARGLDAEVAAAVADPLRRGCLHIRVVAPPRSGWRIAIDEVAWMMRSLGCATLRADLALPARLRQALRHRHLVLIAPGPAAAAPAARWVAELMRASDRAHVLIERVCERPPDRDAATIIELRRCRDGDLLAACGRDDAQTRAAIEKSEGWPGRFVDAWAGQERSPAAVVIAREAPSSSAVTSCDAAWPFSASAVPGREPARLLIRAERCHRRGRGAEGDDWLHAGLESARRRGDAQAASRTLERWVPQLIHGGRAARAAAMTVRALQHAQDPTHRAALARLAAGAYLEAAQVGRAETCIETAICIEQLAERCASEASLSVRAALRFWQGRWVEGQAELDQLPRAQQERPRIALWRDWFRWAADAPGPRRSPPAEPDVAVGDDTYRLGLEAFRAAGTDVAADVHAALASPAVIPDVWRRVMAGQAWLEFGDSRAAIDAVSRGLRAPARRGLADAALASLRVALGVASAPEAAWLARVVTSERLKGVARFGQGRTAMQMWQDVAHLLEVVQSSEDEQAGLQHVCGWVRASAGAGTCTLIGAPYGAPLAGDTLEVSDAVARQWLERPVEALDDGTMACRVRAPIRYGGSVVGLIVATGAPARSRAIFAAVQAAAAVSGALTRARLDAEAAGARTEEVARDILGASPAIAAVRAAAARAALAPFPVVIEGESGTGKELVARALHRLGPRRDRPFAALNCAALTDELVEAELFGHARGAFTHAVNARAGLFEEAHHGTLFLDEVGDLSPRAQAKLLRVLQEGEIRRVGENEARAVDVRVVCATNRPLAALVAAGRFRDDLMFRLSVIRIGVPPLRERRADVAPLAAAFWRQAAKRVGTRAVLGADALSLLAEWPWPGNVRELQNAMAAVAVAAPAAGRVGARLVRQVLRHGAPGTDAVDIVPLDAARRDVERRIVSAALARHTGSRTAAAQALGLSRQGLCKAMRRLGLAEAGVA